MKSEKRILVVEDTDSMRTQYVTSFELAGYSVDSVSTLEDALNIIDAKTFHIAIVDLTLQEASTTQFEGLSVLKKLQEVGEGTGAIVISGQTSPGTAADTITEYGAAKYLSKLDIINKGMSFIEQEVSLLLSRVELKKYGKSDNILPILAGPGANMGVWAYQFLSVLKPKEAASGLNRFLENFCSPLAPLMPQRDADPPMEFHQEARFARGQFWSKALGIPLELIVCRSDQAEEIVNKSDNPVWQTEPVTKPYVHFGLSGYAFELSEDISRSEFVSALK